MVECLIVLSRDDLPKDRSSRTLASQKAHHPSYLCMSSALTPHLCIARLGTSVFLSAAFIRSWFASSERLLPQLLMHVCDAPGVGLASWQSLTPQARRYR
jgi:hypothetical protein